MASLVLIHGAGEDRRMWDRQVAALGAAHRVLAVDLPGRGERLDVPAARTLADRARDVLAQMDAAGMDRAVVVGHSMGGAVALLLALDHPARVAGLVLVCTGARLRMHPDFVERARRRAEGAEPAEGPTIPLDLTVAPCIAPDDLRFAAARATGVPPATVYADFLATDGFDVRDRLGAVQVPTLVVGGDQDRMTPPRFSEYLAAGIPGARLVILSGCGHRPFVERTAAFDQALAGFLRQAGLDGATP